ncbi:hypothetical protein [Limisalsivibrio acetivorans]|uniref:hypothetical protein n=1 Tax=Limisalsivibrio acetivorans TaxID=1304888 RepID=UPI00138AB4B2|nr:hypothetical protein [Limisalsivibrio acetivorans]
MKAYANYTFEVATQQASMDGSPEVKNMELCFIFCSGSKRSEGFAESSGREILRMMNFPDISKPEVREGKVSLPEQQWNFHGW